MKTELQLMKEFITNKERELNYETDDSSVKKMETLFMLSEMLDYVETKIKNDKE